MFMKLIEIARTELVIGVLVDDERFIAHLALPIMLLLLRCRRCCVCGLDVCMISIT